MNKWRVYGDGISSVDIYYSVSSDSNLNASAEGYLGDKWRDYSQMCQFLGLNSYEWDLTVSESDSVRIRIVSDESSSRSKN